MDLDIRPSWSEGHRVSWMKKMTVVGRLMTPQNCPHLIAATCEPITLHGKEGQPAAATVQLLCQMLVPLLLWSNILLGIRGWGVVEE